MKDEIMIDEKSGISIDEQKEILTQINGIAEKNRKQLSAQGGSVAAKKKGALFPLAVNIGAALILAAGAFLLVSFNGRADTQARTGTVVFNLTERALIEEIRKDTSEKIAAKEIEIAQIASRLDDVDNELYKLYSSNQDLTLEQRETQERLLAAQNTFRAELSKLQDERTEILEDSRSKEARLRAQLDERAREFAAAQARSSGELAAAARELERLSAERDKLDAINALLSGSLAATNVQLQESRVDRGELNDLQAKNLQLQNKIDEMQKAADAYNSAAAGQDRRLAELDQTVTALRAANSTLEQSVTDKDRNISSLQTENSDLRAANTAQEQRITVLNNRLDAARASLSD